MNELQIFNSEEFGEIRTVTVNDEVWFVAKDVCEALKHTNTTVAMQMLEEDERTKLSLGRAGETNCINRTCNCQHNSNSRDNEPCCRCDSRKENREVKIVTVSDLIKILDTKENRYGATRKPRVLNLSLNGIFAGSIESVKLDGYRNKLPKFRNGLQIDENGKSIRGTGHMVFNWFTWEKDGKDIPKIHPAQKPVAVLKKLIEIFTDDGDVVIDPCCGSGSTLRAAAELGRSAYGFEIDRNFYERAKNEMFVFENDNQMDISDFI